MCMYIKTYTYFYTYVRTRVCAHARAHTHTHLNPDNKMHKSARKCQGAHSSYK